MRHILVRRLTLGVLLVLGVAGAVSLPGPAAADDREGLANWCVAPNTSSSGPCARYPAARRKTTLTLAIAAASPGHSVHVYPGTYTDKPNVTKRLIIKGVRGPDVTIFDGGNSSDAALKVSAGGVVLEGFTFTHSQSGVTGGVGGGVDAANNMSHASNTICEFQDRELPTDPVVPACPRALQGSFTLKNSRVSGNWSQVTCDGDTPRCYGVKVVATGRVTITGVEASNNGSGGDCTGHGYPLTKGRGPDGESCFGIMAFSTGSDVVLKDVKANNNRAKGNCYRHETCFGVMVDETAGNATLEEVTANGNGADGNCSGDDVCFGIAADGVQGKVTMEEVEAKYNGAEGSCVTASGTSGFPQYGPIPLNDACAGIVVDGEDWSKGLSIDGAIASHNGAFGGNCGDNSPFFDAHGSGTRDACVGLIIDGRGGDIVLRNVKANDNGATGNCQGNDMCAGITHDPSDIVGVFQLTNVQANNNGAGGDCLGRDSCFGILHDTGFCSGKVEFYNVEASYNGAGGNCPANDSCQGIVIDSGDNTGSFTFTRVKANYNGARSDCGANDNCNGILIDGGGVTHDPLDPQDLDQFCPVITSPRPFFVSLTEIEVNRNGAGQDCSTARDQCSGIIVDGVLGPVTMKEVSAEKNGAGRDCLGPDSCNGVLVDVNDEAVTLREVEAENNGAGQNCLGSDSCNGVLVDSGGTVTLREVEAEGNGAPGTCHASSCHDVVQ